MSFVLHTDWDGFLDESKKRWPSGTRVFVDRDGAGTVVTVAESDKGLLVRASVALGLDEVSRHLTELGHAVRRGRWSTTSETDQKPDVWVGAVAYESSGERAGLWIDFWRSEPSMSDVLTAMIREFVAEGTIGSEDADEFSVAAKPNIIVVGPDEVATFLASKVGGSPHG